jgi:hypothetical protein
MPPSRSGSRLLSPTRQRELRNIGFEVYPNLEVNTSTNLMSQQRISLRMMARRLRKSKMLLQSLSLLLVLIS